MRRPTVVTAAVVVAAIALVVLASCGSTPGEMIEPDEAFALLERGEAIMVDVRDILNYEEAHIAGAIAVPYHDLDSEEVERLKGFDRTVITYCACPAEETSSAAAEVMIRNGLEDVLVLKGGIQEWVALGHPLRFGMSP